jgi:hypothetical protein
MPDRKLVAHHKANDNDGGEERNNERQNKRQLDGGLAAFT